MLPWDSHRARKLALFAFFGLFSFGLAGCASTIGSEEASSPAATPIVFVHGTVGSASQYQTQAMRFASNGYPREAISAFEYATVDRAVFGQVLRGAQNDPLNAHIDRVLTTTGADQVYLVCHSLGTAVCSVFLSDPDRAKRVAGYVAVDGHRDDTCPGGVPCLGIFGDDEEASRLGDNNVHLPNEEHVEVATSAASFAAQYEFITGEAPTTTAVVPEEDSVTVSGRAVYFPANEGADGATLAIWPIDAATGHRIADEPVATYSIDARGDFGPLTLDPDAHYEFHLERPGRADHHFYRQPIPRSTDFVRLTTSPEGSEITEGTHTGPNHVAMVVTRDKEWRTNHDDGDHDTLRIRTASIAHGDQAFVDVLHPGMDEGERGVIGIHLHDDRDSPGETTGDLLPLFADRPFQSGVDIFMPADPGGLGTVTLVSVPRGGIAREQVINVPNWPSSEHRVTVIFSDFVQP